MKIMPYLLRGSVVLCVALLMGIATAQADPLAPVLQVAFGGTVEDYGAPQESIPQGWYPFFLDNWWLGPSDTLAHNKAWYGSASMTYSEIDLVDASLHTVTLTDIDNHGGFESWIVGGSGYATSEPYGLTGCIRLIDGRDCIDVVVGNLTPGLLYSIDVVQSTLESDYLFDPNGGSPIATWLGDNIITESASIFGTIEFQLTAVESSSGNPLIAGFIITPTLAKPPVPSGLHATAGAAQVTLSWNASAGATSYHVKRSTVSGGETTTLASPTAAGYSDLGLDNGKTYYYVVSALNTAGESANSSEVCAMPLAPASMSGFELWANGQGLTGDVAALLGQIGSNGVANGFAYAFGTNLVPGQNLLDIRLVDGHPVVEVPKRDTGTIAYVDVLLTGCTNLSCIQSNWTLSVAPSARNLGKPANRDWYEPSGSPSNAFFRLQATLLTVSAPTITTVSPLPSGTVGTYYNQSLTANGGVKPYAWSLLFGSLPSGLFLDSGGSITGMPTAVTTADFTLQVTGNDNASASNSFSLTISAAPVPPSITTQPHTVTNHVGSDATFSVAAAGTAPLRYQWQRNGMNLSNGGQVSGATNTMLTVANVQISNAGNYNVLVSNTVGSVTSAVAVLNVLVPPSISQQPRSVTNNVGATVYFNVAASGTGPLVYQWQWNGTNLFNGGQISGANNTMLTVANIKMSNAGNYNVLITNSVGSVTSAAAVLTVK